MLYFHFSGNKYSNYSETKNKIKNALNMTDTVFTSMIQ